MTSIEISVSRALALLLAVALAAVLVPAGVEAATNLVVIKDANSSGKAQVDSGKLRVGDGAGPVTVNGNVDVAGPVDTRPRAPGTPIQALTFNDGVTQSASTIALFKGSTQDGIAMGSMTFAAEGPNPGVVKLMVGELIGDPGEDCITGARGIGSRFLVIVPVGETVHLDWPTPMVWRRDSPDPQETCVNAISFSGPTGYEVFVTGTAFKP